MVNQLSAFLVFLLAAIPILIKAGGAVGLIGTAIEGLGLLLKRFAHPALQATGSVFVRVGKTLEAVGIDAPKLTNALSWIAKIKGLLNVAVLAVVVSLGLLCVAACATAPCSPTDAVMAAHALECRERVRLECADVLDSECPAIKECDAWGEARCGFAAGGVGGSAGAGGAP